jgi:D-alanyl-D-alanine carboxypeptidase
MKNDAEKDNIFIKITSAFRSYETQKSLYQAKEKVSDDPGMYLAEPGRSEHQLGTAIDISGSSVDYGRATMKFENSIEDTWLENNAHKYGFIQSYPKGKESITGYGYEPWHYRYVGIENAKYIKENNITILEFLGSINKN